MFFEMKIGLNEEYMRRLFSLHERNPSSGKPISDTIEKALKDGIDKGLNGKVRR